MTGEVYWGYKALQPITKDKARRIWSAACRNRGRHVRHYLIWLILADAFPFQVPPAFAARIREDFDCDLPWLCLADHLEEDGEPEHAAHLRAAVERSAGA